MKIAIINGSSRKDGNTSKIIEEFLKHQSADCFDLIDYTIGQYNYEHNHQDDFLPLMKQLVEYDMLIFATPVYWYAMSGYTKVFLDRITDCLKIDKETGRKLKGMKMGVISCGSENYEIKGFYESFKLSAEYLGMEYTGELSTWYYEQMEDEVKDCILKFVGSIQDSL